jgi:hypothetical protein
MVLANLAESGGGGEGEFLGSVWCVSPEWCVVGSHVFKVQVVVGSSELNGLNNGLTHTSCAWETEVQGTTY